MKICSKCKFEKALEKFYKGRGECKACFAAAQACRYDERREEILARQAAYGVTHRTEIDAYQAVYREENRVGLAAYQATYRAANPKRIAAQGAVRHAVKSGKLVRGPCAHCGSDGPVDGHHPDYDRPLEVLSLCRGCHQRLHARLQRCSESDGR